MTVLITIYTVFNEIYVHHCLDSNTATIGLLVHAAGKTNIYFHFC